MVNTSAVIGGLLCREAWQFWSLRTSAAPKTVWNPFILHSRGLCRVCWHGPQQPPPQKKSTASATKVTKSHRYCWPPREGDTAALLPKDMHTWTLAVPQHSHPRHQITGCSHPLSAHTSLLALRLIHTYPHLRHHCHQLSRSKQDPATKETLHPWQMLWEKKNPEGSPAAFATEDPRSPLCCCRPLQPWSWRPLQSLPTLALADTAEHAKPMDLPRSCNHHTPLSWHPCTHLQVKVFLC